MSTSIFSTVHEYSTQVNVLANGETATIQSTYCLYISHKFPQNQTINLVRTQLPVTPHTRLYKVQWENYSQIYTTHQVCTAVQTDPSMKKSRDGGMEK